MNLPQGKWISVASSGILSICLRRRTSVGGSVDCRRELMRVIEFTFAGWRV